MGADAKIGCELRMKTRPLQCNTRRIDSSSCCESVRRESDIIRFRLLLQGRRFNFLSSQVSWFPAAITLPFSRIWILLIKFWSTAWLPKPLENATAMRHSRVIALRSGHFSLRLTQILQKSSIKPDL